MPNTRKDILTTGEIYHIYTRSISGFEVFRAQKSFERIIKGLVFYNRVSFQPRLSNYLSLTESATQKADFISEIDPIVQIVAYCVMPTHIHLILKQLYDDSISSFMSNLLNSYTRYFNLAHNRRGPLWESKFKNVLVNNDEQLLHLTRYVHLNPSSAGLVAMPENWPYSSYREYLGINSGKAVCNWKDILEIQTKEYRKFVNSRVSYQRNLSKIKPLLIENYTG